MPTVRCYASTVIANAGVWTNPSNSLEVENDACASKATTAVGWYTLHIGDFVEAGDIPDGSTITGVRVGVKSFYNGVDCTSLAEFYNLAMLPNPKVLYPDSIAGSTCSSATWKTGNVTAAASWTLVNILNFTLLLSLIVNSIGYVRRMFCDAAYVEVDYTEPSANPQSSGVANSMSMMLNSKMLYG